MQKTPAIHENRHAY
jgi:solute carrier family 25 (mitochondrial uncoupling protein), member 8/9